MSTVTRSTREEILRLVAEGKQQPDIAATLGITQQAVSAHLRRQARDTRARVLAWADAGRSPKNIRAKLAASGFDCHNPHLLKHSGLDALEIARYLLGDLAPGP